MRDILAQYRNEVIDEACNDILPFWMKNTVDLENGGFYGSINNDMVIQKDGPKGTVLLSRILWTFSCAYKEFGNGEYFKTAKHAYDFMSKFAIDRKYGGIFWLLSYNGSPLDDKKQVYAQAFAVYALSEYYSATDDRKALDEAIAIFKLMERHTYDRIYKGYFDACNRDWTLKEDMSLSDIDLNSRKSMNTNLHILEAYTNLSRYWDDAGLKSSLKELVGVTIDHIIDTDSGHFMLYFDDRWNSMNDRISYGHDIEGSWLLDEAAGIIGDNSLIEKAEKVALKMAEVTYAEGIDSEGALVNEGGTEGVENRARDWWPQAEAMVGFLNAYRISGDGKYLDVSLGVWDFIKRKMIDKKYGEWFWSVDENGTVDGQREKAGVWKCPYHNFRSCFEVKKRTEEILESETGNR